MTAITSDRIAGTLLGLACGDALGAPYEFGPGTLTPEMKGGGPFGWEPGEWTDDTQMAICIAEEGATGQIVPSAVGDRFVAWIRGQKDVGIQTRAVVGGASSGADLPALAAEHFARHPSNAAGNGSLMRTAPVALACLGDREAMAAAAMEISALTHGDPLAGEACVLWCIGIDRAISHGDFVGVRQGLEYLPENRWGQWETWLDEAETEDPSTFTGNGFVVRALQAAYASILRTPVPDEMSGRHLQQALATAISIGHDTDTVAAIAGALLGARWGASAIPAGWLASIHGWPGYTARDLVRLAILTANKGKPDSDGWPGVGSMAKPYAALGPMGTTAVSFSWDEFVTWGDFGGLAMAADEADIVVSLCRMGEHDVPGNAIRVEPWLIDKLNANANLELLLADLAGWIDAWREEGKHVYVHCVAAESRTPAVAAAYIAHQSGAGADRAMREVYQILPHAHPNADFRAALEEICG